MDEPLTVLCLAQGSDRPIYDIPLEIAVVKVLDTDDSGVSNIGYQAFREDVEDALSIYVKRMGISDPDLTIYKVVAAANIRTNKVTYSAVTLVEYPQQLDL